MHMCSGSQCNVLTKKCICARERVREFCASAVCLPCALLLINGGMYVPKAELHCGAHLSELCGLDTAEARGC